MMNHATKSFQISENIVMRSQIHIDWRQRSTYLLTTTLFACSQTNIFAFVQQALLWTE